MKVLLYIAPHLSTGGLPQYLTKKVELLKNIYKIYVVEYEDITGGRLVIQKNKIKDLLGDNLITIPWGGSKQILIDTINNIKPDIIHLEEMPEYFMSDDIAKQIYTSDRKYKIFETSHDSSFDTSRKKYQPDKFILVSNYQVGMLKSLNIPSEVVEYPIEFKERPNREQALIKLGLDPTYKHVLHVGLYTPRKNQAEFYEYANQFLGEKVMFHSLGNMADNFRYYWEPLLNNKPDNMIWHGEKTNVDDYYAAMDLFLFTSKGTVNDKETMPLVMREAISWNIPTLIYNLPVYENYFDKFKNIQYLDFSSKDENLKKIKSLLYGHDDKTVVIISSYPTTESTTKLTLDSIISAKEQGYEVILASHAKVPLELQEKANYVVYDHDNILTHHDFYSLYWTETDRYKVDMNIKSENNDVYHGPAVYTNYRNAIGFAKELGYTNAICHNFDMDIVDENVYKELVKGLKHNKAVFNYNKAQEGDCLRTVLFATRTDFFCKNFRVVETEQDYTTWKNDVGSGSNGLENMFYYNLKDKLSEIKMLSNDEFYGLLSNCKIDTCSRVEYFNVLSVENNPNQFAVWFNSSNLVDNRTITIDVVSKDTRDLNRIDLTKNQMFYKIYDFDGNDFEIKLMENRVMKKKIVVNKSYMENNIKNNGKIKIK